MTQGIEQGVGATLVAVRNGPGARLRAAREAMGFTELEVAQQLRLSESTIERLEQDNYDTHLPLVFVKGYLRSYAGLIGLDPEQVLLEFAHLGIHDPVRDVPDLGHGHQSRLSNFSSGTPKHRPGLLWGSLAIFACGMLAFMWSYRDQLPALGAPAETNTTISTTITPQSEESELNAAIEAARHANAQANAPAAASAPATATPPAAATTAPAPAAPTLNSTAKPLSGGDSNDSSERPVKPVSVNAVSAPAAKPHASDKTHETMLF